MWKVQTSFDVQAPKGFYSSEGSWKCAKQGERYIAPFLLGFILSIRKAFHHSAEQEHLQGNKTPVGFSF